MSIGCGKAEPTAASPSTEAVAAPEPAEAPAPEPTVAPEPESAPVARVELEAAFHRTRVGTSGGFWVLGVITNHHTQVIVDARAEVRLLDEAGERVGGASGEPTRALAAGEQAAVAVHVAEPVEHEQLELHASGIPGADGAVVELPLIVEYEQPQRAELGGWFVLGQVENAGRETITGARIEVQGLDRDGQLLGVDWLILDPIDADETAQFDLGGLRYEETPASFVIEPRPPLE